MTPTSVKITSRIRDYGNYIQKILELRANLKLRGGPLCTTNNSYSESLPSPGKVDDGYWNFFFCKPLKFGHHTVMRYPPFVFKLLSSNLGLIRHRRMQSSLHPQQKCTPKQFILNRATAKKLSILNSRYLCLASKQT